MESARHKTGLADRVRPQGMGASSYSAQGVESRVHLELSGQFASAIAFADFCTFLTSNTVSDQAEQLASLAEALYEETTAELRRSRPRG